MEDLFPNFADPCAFPSSHTQVQTIGFLSHLKSKGINGPFLVIGPLSTLPNWITEFERFCPALPAVLYHGSKQEREELRMGRLKPPGVWKCGHGCAGGAVPRQQAGEGGAAHGEAQATRCGEVLPLQ